MSRMSTFHRRQKAGAAAARRNTHHGYLVHLTVTPKNTLEIEPEPEMIAEFIAENSDHLPTDIIEKLHPGSVPEGTRRYNVWGDDETLKELLDDYLTADWAWVDPKDINALTDAVILEAPDGRIYYHDRHQVESAAEELLLGKTVKFEGAPENKEPAPKIMEPEEPMEPKMSKRKRAADIPPEDSIVDEPEKPMAPPPAPKTMNPFSEWQTQALIDTIENLTGSESFPTAKPEQEAVGQMADVLSERPVEQEQMETKKAALKKASFAKRAAMDSFTHAYIEAALWSSTDESDSGGGRPLDDNYNESDIDPETLAQMVRDCEKFQKENAEWITEEHCFSRYDADEQAGHDFWLTRNGHGSGFSDGDWDEEAEKVLEAASDAFGEFDLYVVYHDEDGDQVEFDEGEGELDLDGLTGTIHGYPLDKATPATPAATAAPVMASKKRAAGFKPERGSDGKFPAYAWPGGYPIIYLDGHGEVLCADCATQAADGKFDDPKTQPVASDVYYEGPPQECADCGTMIESAYGDPDAPEESDEPKMAASKRKGAIRDRMTASKKKAKQVPAVIRERIAASKTKYNKDEWPERTCVECGTKNYVEPHGTTTECKKCKQDTEHVPHEDYTKKASGKKAADGAGPQNADTGKHLEGDTSIPRGADFDEDHTGITVPPTELPEKVAAMGAPPQDADTGKHLEGDNSFPRGAEFDEDKTGIPHPPTTLPKDASVVSTASALKLAETIAEKLQDLYMQAKPITRANESRPVRDAVEMIYEAMKGLGEAIKILSKQERSEAEEEVAAAAAKKKSSLLRNLKMADMEPEEPTEASSLLASLNVAKVAMNRAADDMVYVYQADLLCKECGDKVRAELTAAGEAPEDPDDENTYDSDDFPKGPYGDGGGESDSPQHCSDCGVFLMNPLTEEGMAYVQEAVNERPESERNKEWEEFYDIHPTEDDDEVDWEDRDYRGDDGLIDNPSLGELESKGQQRLFSSKLTPTATPAKK